MRRNAIVLVSVLTAVLLCLACACSAAEPASAEAQVPQTAEPAEATAEAEAEELPSEEPADAAVTEEPETEKPAAPTGAFSQEDMALEIGGTVYAVRTDSAPVIAALGEEYEYSEAQSCVYVGDDKLYEYEDISVSTVPVDGKDIIEMFTIYSDAYKTMRGVGVGDSYDDVVAAYGENYFDDGYLTYSITADPEDVQAERIQFEYDDDKAITVIYIYSPSY